MALTPAPTSLSQIRGEVAFPISVAQLRIPEGMTRSSLCTRALTSSESFPPAARPPTRGTGTPALGKKFQQARSGIRTRDPSITNAVLWPSELSGRAGSKRIEDR